MFGMLFYFNFLVNVDLFLEWLWVISRWAHTRLDGRIQRDPVCQIKRDYFFDWSHFPSFFASM